MFIYILHFDEVITAGKASSDLLDVSLSCYFFLNSCVFLFLTITEFQILVANWKQLLLIII